MKTTTGTCWAGIPMFTTTSPGLTITLPSPGTHPAASAIITAIMGASAVPATMGSMIYIIDTNGS